MWQSISEPALYDLLYKTTDISTVKSGAEIIAGEHFYPRFETAFQVRQNINFTLHFHNMLALIWSLFALL